MSALENHEKRHSPMTMPKDGNFLSDYHIACFPGGSLAKNPPVMRETWVQSLDWEDPLEKGKATHFHFLFFLKMIILFKIYFNWRLITLQYCSGFAIH